MKSDLILYLILFIIGIPITIWALIMSDKKKSKKGTADKPQKQTNENNK